MFCPTQVPLMAYSDRVVAVLDGEWAVASVAKMGLGFLKNLSAAAGNRVGDLDCCGDVVHAACAMRDCKRLQPVSTALHARCLMLCRCCGGGMVRMFVCMALVRSR